MKAMTSLVLDPRMQAAIEELETLILQRYPGTQFRVSGDPEGSEAIHLWATVDLDEPDEVVDLVLDRMMEMQIDDDLPLLVIPTRTPERIAAMHTAPKERPRALGPSSQTQTLSGAVEHTRQAQLARHRATIEQLCRRYHVRRLDLFGSAATGRDRLGESDLDFLVDFEPLPAGAYADTYFGLHEALEELFERPIDLVVDSSIKNPYFRQSVDQTKVPLFAA